MLMGVYVVEAKTSRAKRLELCSDFLYELISNSRQKEISEGGTRHIRIERAISAYEAKNLCPRESRNAVHQDKVQPNPEIRQPAGARHGIDRRRGRDH